MSDARVEARGVAKDYPRAGASGGVLTAVRPLDLELDSGSLTVITGRSGLSRASLVPRTQIAEDLLCGFGELGLGGEAVAVDVDGDLLKWSEFADESLDAHPGGLLQVAGDGQGGHHDGQVGLDRVAGAVEDRAGSQVVLGHAERLLHVPQLVVGGDHLVGPHDAGGDVAHVALQARHAPGAGQCGLVDHLVAPVGGGRTGSPWGASGRRPPPWPCSPGP